jgi:hypothetical protein
MRYLKQTDNFSCGVIAAMNLDIWRGKKVLRRDFEKYRKYVKCKRGTYRYLFSRWVKFSPTRFNWPELKDHLRHKGSAVVMTCRIRAEIAKSNHFYFIDKLSEDGNWARCINIYSDATIMWVHWRRLCKLLLRSSVWEFER